MVAPAFEQWAARQQQVESERSARWKEQYLQAWERAGDRGLLLLRFDGFDSYVLFFGEASRRRPVKRGDLHFTTFALEIDARRCTWRVYEGKRRYPPTLPLRRFESLVDAVTCLMAQVEEEMPDAFPKIAQEDETP